MKSARRRAVMPEFAAGPRLQGRCRGALPVKPHLTESLVLQALRARCERRHIRCSRCLSGRGDICRSGRLAVKSAGTVWANPSRGGDAKPPVRAVSWRADSGVAGASDSVARWVERRIVSRHELAFSVEPRQPPRARTVVLLRHARHVRGWHGEGRAVEPMSAAVLSIDFDWRAK